MLKCIVNLHSKSGYARVIWGQVEQVLKQENVEYEVFFTEYKGHATQISKELTSGNEKIRLVVLGGDGTINEVVGGIIHFENVILGYIPTGSSNDLARSLKLPSDPKEAILNIINPKYFVQLDIGEVSSNENKRKFMVSCGFGVDALICQKTFESKLKKILNKLKLGKLTYVATAIKQIILYQTSSMIMTVDGNTIKKYNRIYFISSHIHKYQGGGLMLCPAARFNDQKLDLCVVKDFSKAKLLFFLPTAYFGKHTGFKDVEILQCNEVTMKASSKLCIHTDGEIFGIKDEITLRIAPEKITMITAKVD